MKQMILSIVEKAKQQYHAQKQAYRSERERRRTGETSMTSETAPVYALSSFFPTSSAHSISHSVPTEVPEITQIVSHARGPYPQVEMYSVPKRANTLPAHGFRRNRVDDLLSRAQNRITKKLADVRRPFSVSFT